MTGISWPVVRRLKATPSSLSPKTSEAFATKGMREKILRAES